MVYAPDVTGEIWFNSKPLKRDDLRGKVVLYDFWTYSCVNCIRTLPSLKKWWSAYQNKGFMLIGIHTPEFGFEKDPQNVEKAIKRLGITWPVLLDNDRSNWNAFGNQFWPAKYLADQQGQIVYTHFGEGGYEDTEEFIEILLGKNADEMPVFIRMEKEELRVCFIPTPELYLGYLRGRLTEPQTFFEDQVHAYETPVLIDQDTIALDGNILATKEYVEINTPRAGFLLKFQATEVNLVLEGNATLDLAFNGQPVSSDFAGKDVINSTLEVKEARMYNLIKSNKAISGTLSIRLRSGSYRAYAFTFSGCVN